LSDLKHLCAVIQAGLPFLQASHSRTQSSISERKRRNEDDKEAKRQTESWHNFETP
jgi:hypothetical protein